MGEISSLFWGSWSTEKRPVRFFNWATGCFAGECLSRGGGDGDGILGVGWPNLLEAEARKAPTPAPPHTTYRAAAEGTREAARGSRIPLVAKTKLDGRQKRAAKDLDPRRTPYHPIPNPRGSEREEEERGQPQEEEQQPQGFQLRPLHHHRNPPPGGRSYFPSPSSSSSSPATASSSDYARLSDRMSEAHGHGYGYGYGHHQQHQQPRFGGGLRGAGEIVEVQGGHIVRSTGRKDRHSKVCTAKGPRDRRVRLSAHTAIQFYDVQDRLGYDRPSKAVDWLIKNAQAAIDDLAKLPSNLPSASNPLEAQAAAAAANQPGGNSSNKPIPVASAAFGFGGGGSGSASFLPPSLDSDAIADTIKSFFPMAAPAATAPSSSPPIGFQSYPSDLASHTSSQDLRLSLQSFHNPIFHNPDPSHHPHSQHHHHQDPTPSTQHALFSGSAHLAYDTTSAGWAEQSQRMVPWNLAETAGGGGYGFNVPPPAPPQAAPLHPVLGQSQFFTQRGPLQSSNSPAIRAWADPIASTTDHQMHPALRTSASSTGFASVAGFSGFRIPARIQGEEEHDGTSDKPPSASSASHH